MRTSELLSYETIRRMDGNRPDGCYLTERFNIGSEKFAVDSFYTWKCKICKRVNGSHVEKCPCAADYENNLTAGKETRKQAAVMEVLRTGRHLLPENRVDV